MSLQCLKQKKEQHTNELLSRRQFASFQLCCSLACHDSMYWQWEKKQEKEKNDGGTLLR